MRTARLSALLLALALTATANAGSGTAKLDPSFGGDGHVYVDFDDKASSQQNFMDVYITPHQKVVAVGYVLNTSRFAVTRRKQNGEGDPKFSFDGKLTTSFGAGTSKAYRVVPAGRGRILVGGTAGKEFVLARYKRNGMLDDSFGGDGKVTTEITPGGGNEDIVHDIVVGGDSITVAGTADDVMAWARYKPNGELDESFGAGGIRVTEPPPLRFHEFQDAVLQPDGKLLAGGRAGTGMLVARYRKNGALDESFHGDGISQVKFDEDASAEALALGPNGKIAVAGFTVYGEYYDWAVAQLSSEGRRDWVSETDGGFNGALAEGVTVQADGKVVATGFYGTGSAVFRYTKAGKLDQSFSDDGISARKEGKRSYGITSRGESIVAGGYEFRERTYNGVLFRYR